MEEGVLLTHALLAHIATENNIRVLFIKGPGLVIQELRLPYQSSDADVLVEPAHFARYLELMEGRGWLRRPTDPDGDRFPSHSVAYYHPQWPNDIDVHNTFPGLEANDTIVFDGLWKNHDLVSMAERQVPIPSLEGSRLLLLLHCLRAPWGIRQTKEYNHLLELDITDPDEFLNLAVLLDALAAARPFIVAKIGENAVDSWPDPSPSWLNKTSASSGGLNRLHMLRQTPLRLIPKTLWRDIFPPKEVLLMNNLFEDVSRKGLAKAYLRRIYFGVWRMITKPPR